MFDEFEPGQEFAALEDEVDEDELEDDDLEDDEELDEEL